MRTAQENRRHKNYWIVQRDHEDATRREKEYHQSKRFWKAAKKESDEYYQKINETETRNKYQTLERETIDY